MNQPLHAIRTFLMSSTVERKPASSALRWMVFAACGLSLPWIAACSPGVLGTAVRPDQASAREALGEAPCRDTSGKGIPLVVDWTPEKRADLEIALRGQLAVVRYNCRNLEVLESCGAREGDYAFAPITPKQTVVQLTNADEVAASLPTQGGAIIADFGAEMKRGSSLDLALVMVGRTSTSRTAVERTELTGSCDGATHFIRRASIGAFAMKGGTQGSVSAAAEIFGAGVSASSLSERLASTKDGDIAACRKGDLKASAAPGGCASVLRLELWPIDATTSRATPGATAAAACPEGMVLAGQRCVVRTADVGHLCDAKRPGDCQRQCELGDLDSCARYGQALRLGSKVSGTPANLDKAKAVLTKGCDADHARSCFLLAQHERFDRKAARSAWEPPLVKACDAGNINGCYEYSMFLSKSGDKSKALRTWRRSCDLGDSRACHYAALTYLQADAAKRVVEPNEQLAATYLVRSCLAGAADNCVRAGRLYEGRPWCEIGDISRNVLDASHVPRCVGVGPAMRNLKADRVRAVDLYQRACFGGQSLARGRHGVIHGCRNLMRAGAPLAGMPNDAPKVLAHVDLRCDANAKPAELADCVIKGYLLSNGAPGVGKDVQRAKEAFTMACARRAEMEALVNRHCRKGGARANCSVEAIPGRSAARAACQALN
jgi:uncharacterized protein